MAKKVNINKAKKLTTISSSNGNLHQEVVKSSLKKKRLSINQNTAISYDIVIPSRVEKKIRKCCELSPNIEWSGVLFYTYRGEFNDKIDENSLIIECVDILPMDIGNAGSTEFEITEDVISYMVDNDLLDCKSGLIHSHHNMSAYFSGVDINTLASEGTYMNNFVSLIVNNEGNYVAGVTRKIKEEREITSTLNASFFDKDTISIPNVKNTDSIEYIEWYDLIIHKEEYQRDPDIIIIEERFKELREAKKVTLPNNPTAMNLTKTKATTSKYTDSDTYDDTYLPYYNYFPSYKDYQYYKSYNGSTPSSKTGLDEHSWYKDDLYGDIDYGMLTVNTQLVGDLIAQIITGDINYLPDTEFNVQEYIENNMEQTYTARFTSPYNLQFKNFVDAMLDVLLNNIDDADLQAGGLDNLEISAAYAYHILLDLSQYESNPYLDIFKNVLSEYIEL